MEHIDRSKGTLFLIPCTISDTSDWFFSSSTQAVLKSLSVIVCERIRTTRRQIRPLFDQDSFDAIVFLEMDKHGGLEYLTEAVQSLKNGERVGILSEAGMPCIADPGYEIVAKAHALNIPVHPIEGPSSFMQALMASGLNGQSFTFHGYLPRESDKLKRTLINMARVAKSEGSSQIFMETPYRNQKLFEEILGCVDSSLCLNISMDISGVDAFLRTRKIETWKRKPFSFDKKLPAVFIIGK